VYLHASGPMGERSVDFTFGHDRETVRGRATATALHLVRRLVTEM
jgi:nicotinamide mononucleotide (NMN) deamidase PncC